MLYQLKNGKTIEISLEHYLQLNDEELEQYLAFNMGSEIEDPFAISVLKYGPITSKEIYGDFDEEEIEDLMVIDLEEKLMDKDFYNEDELEV